MSKYIISIAVWFVGVIVTAIVIVTLILPILAPEPGNFRMILNLFLGFIQGAFWYGFARFYVFEKLEAGEK